MRINQHQFIREFNDANREHFNEELFQRDDDIIIREIERAILSCQRNRAFRLKVLNFDVVDDFNEINRLMLEYEKDNANRSKSIDNKYNYIQLKDTDIRLLIVHYYIEVYNNQVDESERSKVLRVYIQIPRTINKYYSNINGNLYISMSQIIESTYNNSNTNSNVGMVAYKVMFMASRIFRFNINNPKDKQSKMETIFKEPMNGVYFSSIIFSKSVHLLKYMLARFGIYTTMQKLGCKYIMLYNSKPDLDEKDFYIIKKHNIFISVPRYIYDNDVVTQSLVFTIYTDIDNEASVATIYSRDYWLIKLGKSFGSKTIDKGYSVLESLESICDISSMEHLRLPPEDKKDIYDIIVWIVREFSELRLKDNLDLSMKRIRNIGEYYACLYAYKLIKGIYRISDKGNKISLYSIEKSIKIDPDYLIRCLSKDKLVNPVNLATDLDSTAVLKYTYKGVSGLGEDNTSIPPGYRHVHKSHVGNVDLDSSSNSDPGMTGMLCPISDMKNGHFSEIPEPNNWREKIEDIYNAYRNMQGKKEALLFKKDLGYKEDMTRIESLNESIEITQKLLNPFSSLDKELYNKRLFSEVLWE